MSLRVPAGVPLGLRLALVFLWIAPGLSAAGAPVRLQLKWHHQFQFAGYYAAQAKGYYAAEGLEVSILEGGSDRPAIAAVLRGVADFGVGDADVLLARLRGEPLVACAAIFQHSPYVIMSRREKGIRTPADLVGARVMLADDQGAAQFRGMLVREGIDPARVEIRAHSWDLDDLTEGRVDAISAYATVEPQLLRVKGIEPAFLRSIDYGVDFYGDTLFTTEAYVRHQPQRVAAFVRASLKGWNHAMEHAEEIADLILGMEGVAKRGVDRELLLHEAREMRPYILPDVVEIGHMNPGRWQRIAETYVAVGMASSTRGLDRLLYAPAPGWDRAVTRRLLWLGLGALVSTGLVVLWNLQKRRKERERSQERLRESEERFRQITEHIDEVFWIIDPGRPEIVYVSPAYETIWGRSRESLYANPREWLEVAHPEDRGRLEQAVHARQADGAYDEQYRIVRPDGSPRWIHDRGFPIRNSTGALHRIVGLARDVTVQKQTLEALRHSEEKFSKAFQSSPDGLALSRLSDGVLVEVNECFLKLSGYSREQALGRSTLELGLWVDPADRDRYWAGLIKNGIVRGQASSFRSASGASREALISGEIIQLDGEPLALTTIRDVTEINKIQQRLVSIYDTVGDVIFLVALEDDGVFRFESVNKRFAATTGLPTEVVVGRRVEEVIPEASLPQVLSRYREAIEQKTVVRWEETSVYPAGVLTGEVSVAPLFDPAGNCTHLVGAVHDITKRKAAEERQAGAEEMLLQSQKLEGIGRLAGGIAHDFNNILGVILGYGELMRRQIGEGHPARPRLEQVIQAAQRAAGLTRQLLAFSRKQVMQPKLLDLGAVVQDLRGMLERVVGEDLEIEVRAPEGLGAVRADPTQIEQVMMNLVINARDAMPKGGHLTIETANVEFDQAYAAAHPPAKVGQFVMLAVSDTGVGMGVETQRHMFEPFFTTKPPGEGTGLGLATVYGVVKQMGGYVWVYSEVGHGTTFKIYLPRVVEPVTAAPEVVAPQSLPRGNETVLVVEDSESLRDMIRELLEEQGYSLLSAAEGEEALALAGKKAQVIDLLLTDVVMPRLGGADLVRQVRALRPGIRVLYMSGYTSGAISKQGVLDQGSNLLEKPFTSEQLARAVRRALDAEPEPPAGSTPIRE